MSSIRHWLCDLLGKEKEGEREKSRGRQEEEQARMAIPHLHSLPPSFLCYALFLLISYSTNTERPNELGARDE